MQWRRRMIEELITHEHNAQTFLVGSEQAKDRGVTTNKQGGWHGYVGGTAAKREWQREVGEVQTERGEREYWYAGSFAWLGPTRK